MRKILSLLLICLFTSNLCADVVNDSKKVSIRAVLPEGDDIPKEAASQLQDKLKRIIISNGLSDNGLTNRFVFTTKINVLQKDIVPTTPARVSLKLEVSFYVGDIIDNKVFTSTSVEVAGIGINENKAYIEAIKRIAVNNTSLKECIESGKVKIAEYYASHCNIIIQEADRKAGQGEFQAAIAELVAVPDVCEECYRLTREKAVKINDDLMDIEGKKLIKEANAAWMVKQDYDCAEKALDILSQVNPLARCSKQADDLMETIDKKLRKDEAVAAAERAATAKRNWEFKMLQYQDKMEMARMKESNNTMLLSKLIGAAENVGCAFGANQPKIINNTSYIKRW